MSKKTPGPDPRFVPRPRLPAGAKALNPTRLAVVVLVELARQSDAVEVGDEEARMAALTVEYHKLSDELEAAIAALGKLGYTPRLSERILHDRRERLELERRHGDGWLAKTMTALNSLEKRNYDAA